MSGHVSTLQLDAFDLTSILVLILVVAIATSLYLWWIGWAIFRKPLTGAESLIGKLGVAITELTPESGGEVSVDGIIWKARLEEGIANKTVAKGEQVLVVRISSLTLIVKRGV